MVAQSNISKLICTVSSDKEICAISSSDDASRIRCYDIHTALGALKYTLVDRSSASNDDLHVSKQLSLFRLEFVKETSFLLAAYSGVGSASVTSCGTIHIWDTKRAVLAHKLDLAKEYNEECILLDMAPSPTGTFCLLLMSRDSGKCILNEYKISPDGKSSQVIRKIKTGLTIATDQAQASACIPHCLAICQKAGEAGEDNTDKVLAALLLDGKARLVNMEDGSRCGKISVPANGATVHFSSKGSHFMIASSPADTDNGMVYLYRTPTENTVGKHQSKERMLAMIHVNDLSFPQYVEMMEPSGQESAPMMITSSDGVTTLYDIDLTSLGKTKKKGTPSVIPCSGTVKRGLNAQTEETEIIRSIFHSSLADTKITCIRGSSPAGGSWTGYSSADIAVSAVTFRADKSSSILKEITLEEEHADELTRTKKRKSHVNVMGSGDATFADGGGRAVTDASQTQKKPKLSGTTELEESFWDLDECRNEIKIADTISDRMEALSRQQESDDDDDHSGDGFESGTLTVRKKESVVTLVNADSLGVLVKQALHSSDEGKLEEALLCTDRKIVDKTVESLVEGEDGHLDLIISLLLKLVVRIARKPTRALILGTVWIRSILENHSELLLDEAASGDAADEKHPTKGGVVLSQILGPLTALLKERVDAYPHLVKLDGRLNLMRLRHGLGM
jgi:hypothetical protein